MAKIGFNFNFKKIIPPFVSLCVLYVIREMNLKSNSFIDQIQRNMLEESGKERFFEISELISAFLSGNLPDEKKGVLEAWIESNERNRILFNRICSENTRREKLKHYDIGEAKKAYHFFERKRNGKVLRRRMALFCACAAAVVLSFGVWYLQGGIDKVVTETSQTVSIPLWDQGKRPLLTLAGGEQLCLMEDGVVVEDTGDGQRVLSGDSVLANGGNKGDILNSSITFWRCRRCVITIWYCPTGRKCG